MKVGYLNGLRSKQLSLTLIIFCTALLIWGWERTSRQVTFLPPHELEIFPQVTRLSYVHQDPAVEEDFPHAEAVSNQVSEKDGHDFSNCNYGRGEWIADERRPLYSGFGCKQWLSEPWSCRLTQRTDFSYENFKWKPEGCELPEFEGQKFLTRMREKTIAFVGDSLGRQQFQSLMCMVTGGEERSDVEDVGEKYGFITNPDAVRPSGWAYRFSNTNTTILYYWSATLCDLEPLNVSNPTTSYAMHLDRPVAFLRQNLHRFDVLILNTGHHWNRGKLKANRWEMYVNGAPNTDRKLAPMGNAKDFAVHSVVRWLDSQLPQHPHLTAFLRSLSPRHFFNGEWNSGGSCDNTIPLARGSVVPQNASGDAVAESATRGTRVRVLDITPLSQLRDEGHISNYSIKGTSGFQDCLHWCLPGIPDTWNEILAARL